ncbi:MAG TPA: serine hydrolase domain-containing protein, partial [Thermomicrobiales bacterium]|nr:serine hydrolase domain-containing protein [Thermomicrobiales bacterium]
GEAFQYSNQMVAAGGYIAAIAAGGTLDTVYDDYVAGMEERVFGPLGMASTTFSFDEVEDNGNFALPHALSLEGEVIGFPLETEIQVAPVAPAGGAWSNVIDLGHFAITQVNQGVAPDGGTVVSAENLEVTWTPRVQIAPGFSYGLGWVVTDYKDQLLLVHDGGTLGYNAEVAFLPDAGLGVAIVANQAGVLSFIEAVRGRVLELAFDQPAEGNAGIEFAMEQQRQGLADLAEMIVPLDESAVTPFLGAWEHPALGEVKLELVDGRLTLDAGEFVSEIVVARDDETEEAIYVTSTPPLGGLRVSLRDEEGRRALVVHDPASTDLYAFTRVAG